MIKSIEKDLQDIDNNYCQAIKDYNNEIEIHKKTINEYKLKIKKEKLLFIDTIHNKASVIEKCSKNVDDEFLNAFPEIRGLGCEASIFNPKKVVEFRNNKAFQELDDWNSERGILPNRFVVFKGETNNDKPIEIQVDNYLNIYYPSVGLYLLLNKVSFPKTSFYLKRQTSDENLEEYRFTDNYSEEIFHSIMGDISDEEILKKCDLLIPKNVHIVYDYHNRFRKFSFFEDKTIDKSEKMVKDLVNEIVDEVTEKEITDEATEHIDDKQEQPVPTEFYKQPWGCEPDVLISKNIITEMVYDYIINNNLINSFNKKTIYTTGIYGIVIAELFHLTEKDDLTIINLHKYIDNLYGKKIVHLKKTPPVPRRDDAPVVKLVDFNFEPWNSEPRTDVIEPQPYTPQPDWSYLSGNTSNKRKKSEQIFETNNDLEKVSEPKKEIYIIYHRGKCEADEPFKDIDNHIFGYYESYEKAKEAMDTLVKNRNDNYIPFINVAINKGKGVTDGLGKGCEEIETFKYNISNQLTSIYKCKLNE
jgi:hypothetical protein